MRPIRESEAVERPNELLSLTEEIHKEGLLKGSKVVENLLELATFKRKTHRRGVASGNDVLVTKV